MNGTEIKIPTLKNLTKMYMCACMCVCLKQLSERLTVRDIHGNIKFYAITQNIRLQFLKDNLLIEFL